MSIKSANENPDIALRSNWVTVDNRMLRADVLKDTSSEKLAVSSDELLNILVLGRLTILQAVEELYAQTVLKNPGTMVTRPSIWTAQLGTTAQTEGRNSKVLTEEGYVNGGVTTTLEEIQPGFRPHWHAIRHAGFVPEVRQASGKRDGGAWLLLRKPSLDDVLRQWFGENKGVTASVVERIKDKDKAEERKNLLDYRTIGERRVDQGPDHRRSRAQIGLIISMAAIKSALGDRTGFEEEIGDALTYADNDPSVDVGAVRAIENSVYEFAQHREG